MKKSHSTWFDWAEAEAERALAGLPADIRDKLGNAEVKSCREAASA